ncbi:NACHT domain-containing protein [Lentzea sp. NPDC058436]|uniref:NACHT domain-containing protein n=1 Tax=Lentzea sp. NPDC058436 TaxID=3346499 RepID=UPI0036586897
MRKNRGRLIRISWWGGAGLGVLSLAWFLAADGLDIGDQRASIVGAVLAASALALSLLLRQGDADEKNRVSRQELFARHLGTLLDEQASQEDWQDEKYSELEAEVELEGGQRRRWYSGRRTDALRRVGSLSKALRTSTERLILLEGHPGSGKSIALRHVAYQLALDARRSSSSDVAIALYVNLKSFRPQRPVTSAAVRDYVRDAVNPGPSADVDNYLDQEFARRMVEGTWLFLFDSFDEIPDILSSTEADDAVNEFAAAISEFLSAWTNCRGVLASREFRGPGRLGWPRFRILRLTLKRRAALVRRFRLRPEVERKLWTGLGKVRPEDEDRYETPLAMNLLCSYLRDTQRFPENPHEVMERFVVSRVERDKVRHAQRFGLQSDFVLRLAEEFAFAMVALGLRADKTVLIERAVESGVGSVDDVTKGVTALTYSKLAHTENLGGVEELTFAHRRIQEYFTTRILLRESDRVLVDKLLSDQNWREAVVTILQTHPKDKLDALVTTAGSLVTAKLPPADATTYQWPAGLDYLLQLLTAGLRHRAAMLGPTVMGQLSKFFARTWREGRRHEKLSVLEALPLTMSKRQHSLLSNAFSSGSPMLREEAYRQLGGLPKVPDDLGRYVRRGLVSQWLTGALRRPQLETVRAWVRRADPAGKLARTLRLLLVIPHVDAVLALAIAGLAIWRLGATIPGMWAEAGLAAGYVAVSHLSLLMIATHPHYSWSPRLRLLLPIQVVRNAVMAVFRREPGHSYRVLGLLVRMSLLVPFALLGVKDPSAVGALAISALLLLWPLSALRAVVNDRVPHVALLPLLPAVNGQRHLVRAGVASGRAVAATGRGLYRRRTGIWETLKGLCYVVAGVALFTGGFALIGMGLSFLVKWVKGSGSSSAATPTTTTTTTSSPKEETPSWTNDVDWPLVWTIVGGVVAVVVLVLVVRHLVIVIRDTRVARAVGRALPETEGEVDVAHIIKIVESARGDRVLLNCIAELRRRGMLQRAERVVTFLSDFAATSERSRTEAGWSTPYKGGKPRMRLAPNCGQDFRDWFMKGSLGADLTSARRERIVRSLSEAAIDEIARLARLRPEPDDVAPAV